MGIAKKIMHFIRRNELSIGDVESNKNRVNLEWWSIRSNFGDALSPAVVNWMLERRNIDPDKEVKETKHLMALGSILGARFDAVVWGSGINMKRNADSVRRFRSFLKLDIRAVRGPLTKDVLIENGYNCDNCVFGDPAVLMPLIYTPAKLSEISGICFVQHFASRKDDDTDGCDVVAAENDDYKFVIDRIVNSKKVVSSSLHGIIVAEAYGIPAVFYNDGMDSELMKYYDWYYSTGRKDVKIASSLREAVGMEPMPLPQLDKMKQELLDSFPYDMWE